jgi:hypothetical protein
LVIGFAHNSAGKLVRYVRFTVLFLSNQIPLNTF